MVKGSSRRGTTLVEVVLALMLSSVVILGLSMLGKTVRAMQQQELVQVKQHQVDQALKVIESQLASGTVLKNQQVLRIVMPNKRMMTFDLAPSTRSWVRQVDNDGHVVVLRDVTRVALHHFDEGKVRLTFYFKVRQQLVTVERMVQFYATETTRNYLVSDRHRPDARLGDRRDDATTGRN